MFSLTSPETTEHRTFGEVIVLQAVHNHLIAKAADRLNGEAARARLLKHAKNDTKKRIEKITRLVSEGKQPAAARLAAHCLNSFMYRYAALAHENRRTKPKNRRLEPWQFVDQAMALDVYEPCTELVFLSEKQKPDGRARSVCQFGPLNRARQRMVMKVLKALHGHKLVGQFALKGGRDVCVDRLISEMNAREDLHFAELDIDDFFGSVEPQALAEEIGLPTKVIQNVISGLTYNFRCSKTVPVYKHDHLLKSCRRGIPQGSIASPVVAAWIVNEITSAKSLVCISYVDNFGITGPTARSVQMRALSLEVAFRDSPLGKFNLSRKTAPKRAANGVEFLGYRLALEDGQVVVRPTDAKFGRALQRMVQKAERLRPRRIQLTHPPDPAQRSLLGKRTKRVRKSEIEKELFAKAKSWMGGYARSTTDEHVLRLYELANYLAYGVASHDQSIPTLLAKSDARVELIKKAVWDHEFFGYRSRHHNLLKVAPLWLVAETNELCNVC